MVSTPAATPDWERLVNDCCQAWYDYAVILAKPDGPDANAAKRDRSWEDADRKRNELTARLTRETLR